MPENTNNSNESKTLLQQRQDAVIAHLDSLPLKARAQGLSYVLIKEAREKMDADDAEMMVSLFRSKEFMNRMMAIMEDKGTRGLLDAMAELSGDDPIQGYEFLTGTTYVYPGTDNEMDAESEEDYLHVNIDD